MYIFNSLLIVYIFKVCWLFTFSKSGDCLHFQCHLIVYISKSDDCLHFQSQLMCLSWFCHKAEEGRKGNLIFMHCICKLIALKKSPPHDFIKKTLATGWLECTLVAESEKTMIKNCIFSIVCWLFTYSKSADCLHFQNQVIF